MGSIFDEDREDRVLSYLDELGFSSHHVEVLNNPKYNTSFDAPYHNVQHLYTVAIHTQTLAKSLEMPLYFRKLLFMAGLYHDVNHSQGKYDDFINIANAKSQATNIISHLEPEFTQDDLRFVVKLIDTTHFPYLTYPAFVLEKVMRDADKLQWVAPDIERWMNGMSLELGKPVSFQSTVDFLSKQVFYLKKSKEMLSKARLRYF